MDKIKLAGWTNFQWLLLGLVLLILSGVAGHHFSPGNPPAEAVTIQKEALVAAPADLAARPVVSGEQDKSAKSQGVPVSQDPRCPGKKAWVAGTPDLRQLEAVIRKNARQQGVDEDLVWAVMRHESGFNTLALSPKGAMGLMQLMPGTAAMLGVKDAFNVEQNVAGGVKYLRVCLDYFDQDIDLALAAYNAGPGNVAKHQGVPPFTETINYVAGVIKDYGAQTRPRGLRASGTSIYAAEPGAVPASGLNWRVPLPRWKVARPQDKVDGPRWRGGIRAAEMSGETLMSLRK